MSMCTLALRFSRLMATAALVGLLAGVAAGGAGAAKLEVAAHGVDSATCGGKAEPCRSISQAIANARNGDKIVVGPGYYGDANRDGDFSDPGDEDLEVGFGCECMIEVDKPVKITSRDGASATVIAADESGVAVVSISVDGVTFGSRGRGFTLTGSGDNPDIAPAGVYVEAEDVRVGGNVAAANLVGFFSLSDTGVIADNVAAANYLGIVVGAGDVSGNAAIGNSASGFWIRGGAKLKGNVASHNGEGFMIEGHGARLEGNVASANRSAGFRVDWGYSSVELSGNLAVGNETGIHLRNDDTSVTRNSVYGNHSNCGIQNDLATDVPQNYWGAANGPGADPADDICGPPSPAVEPVLRKPKKVKTKTPLTLR